MFDVWKYNEQIKVYLIKKYGFCDIHCAKRIKDNLLICLCYHVPDGKITRHQFTCDEINEILKLREKKLNKIVDGV